MGAVAAEAAGLGVFTSVVLVLLLVRAAKTGRARARLTRKSVLAQAAALVVGYVVIVTVAALVGQATDASSTSLALVTLPVIAFYVCVLIYLSIRSRTRPED